MLTKVFISQTNGLPLFAGCFVQRIPYLLEPKKNRKGVAPAGSTIVFDYFDHGTFDPERVSKHLKQGMDTARREGEPPITGFDPFALAAELANLRLSLQENLGPDDIKERYLRGRTDGYYACEHVHFVRAVVE